ncbi:hypothetical protein PCO86_11350 [Pectobacteriaceae bacterium CE70]|nr:hypothetical protein PCO87_11710 [Pectobacteriaceae bacterium C52]WJV64943.1 hypothetical protein PCO86_11350 [Pectobacteriaceae bacterium CE70]WJY08963.1 hypothetical protein PCO80_11210 [Pectobacteriaceae bacterium C80]
MFKLEKIEPIFTYDIYGFTTALINYMNFECNEFPEKVKLEHILNCAFIEDSSYDQKIIKHTLFLIYQSVLMHSSKASCSCEYYKNILEIKNKIEYYWLTVEPHNKCDFYDKQNISAITEL